MLCGVLAQVERAQEAVQPGLTNGSAACALEPLQAVAVTKTKQKSSETHSGWSTWRQRCGCVRKVMSGLLTCLASLLSD